jgi:hypothetical protein
MAYLARKPLAGDYSTMNVPSTPLDAHASTIKSAIQQRDLNGLVAQAEALMRWQQCEVDDEKMQAAALLDEIAAYLMRTKEYAAARMVIMGSLRVKGTLGKESGLTTFSYQQLEECDRASDRPADLNAVAEPLPSFWAANSRTMIILGLLAVASVWGAVVFFVK